MRTMIRVTIPVEMGNTTIKNGQLPKVMGSFVERWKPEAAYFYADNLGRRTGSFVIDLPDSSDIPSIAEPFFQELGASVELTPVMNAEDLKKGLEKAMAG